MFLKPGTLERRSFGRRSAAQHGWIKVPGRQALPCVVDNVSVDGALLACESARTLPFSFELIIETETFHAYCEVKHVSDTHVGVRFCEGKSIAQPASGSKARARDDVSSWMGTSRK